jgi:PiT family inorganic phosphate transporter
MAANRSGLQMDTLRNLLLAWVLTLPVCVLLGAGIFAIGLNLLLPIRSQIGSASRRLGAKVAEAA